jgi:hypothetical protein
MRLQFEGKSEVEQVKGKLAALKKEKRDAKTPPRGAMQKEGDQSER